MTYTKHLSILATIAFSLHLVWENLHARLYGGYESFPQHFFVCLRMTIGDVIITFLVWALMAALKKNSQWVEQAGWWDYAVVTLVGFFTALIIEQNALFLDRWSYKQAMPLIPYLQIGLTPVLQMTILLPLSFFLTKKLTLFKHQ